MTQEMLYHLTTCRNGTEDEFAIHAPDGRQMAFIWFWDEPDSDHAARALADAQLIVDALNAFRKGQ
jgi:hypothetical protein